MGNQVAQASSSFSPRSLVVTCLAFARLGFARQPVLVQLYRSVYAALPQLTDAQLAHTFFLFSTSGIKDDALLRRFVFESVQRLPQMRGQDLSNVLLACSRTLTKETLAGMDELGTSLRERVFDQLDGMQPAPVLGVFLALPQLFDLTDEEKIRIMETLRLHFPRMEVPDLSRCLLAAARAEVAHR